MQNGALLRSCIHAKHFRIFMDIAVFFGVFLRQYPTIRHYSLYLVYRLLPALKARHSVQGNISEEHEMTVRSEILRPWLWGIQSSRMWYCVPHLIASLLHVPFSILGHIKELCSSLIIRNVMLLTRDAGRPFSFGCPRLRIQHIRTCSIYADNLRFPSFADGLCHGGKGCIMDAVVPRNIM